MTETKRVEGWTEAIEAIKKKKTNALAREKTEEERKQGMISDFETFLESAAWKDAGAKLMRLRDNTVMVFGNEEPDLIKNLSSKTMLLFPDGKIRKMSFSGQDLKMSPSLSIEKLLEFLVDENIIGLDDNADNVVTDLVGEFLDSLAEAPI